MSDIGVGIASGMPIPFIWERNGSKVTWYFVGEFKNNDGITIRWEYDCD
jgi:hypothetical protein